MYCDFYQLRERPFNVTSDPKFLYLNACYREALASLSYGITQRKGFITLIGEAGTGKTTLLKKLMDDLDENTRTVFIFNTNVSFDEILEYIFHEFDLPVHNRKRLYMLQHLNSFLLEELGQGRNVALLIDEAQDLDFSVMEDLRLLSNLETAKEKILQIVLSGQPELGQKLGNPGLRQLRQRVAINCRLQPLSPDEVSEYIQARLMAAGSADPKLFSRDAEAKIYEISSGIPRLVNIVCDNALVIGYALGKKRLGGDVITEAAADLFSTGELGADEAMPVSGPATPRQRSRWSFFSWTKWAPSQLGMVVVVVAAILIGLVGHSLLGRESDTPQPSVSRRPLEVLAPARRLESADVARREAPPAGHVPDLQPAPVAQPQVPVQREVPPPARRPVSADVQPSQDTGTPDWLVAAPEVAAVPARDRTAADTAPAVGAVAERPARVEAGAPRPAVVQAPASAPAIAAPAPAEPAFEPVAVAAVEPPAPEVPESEPARPRQVKTESTGKLLVAMPIKKVVKVRRGDSVSGIASRRYGRASYTILDLLKLANPSISNIDKIKAGQRLRLPSLVDGLALLKEGDDLYALLLLSSPQQRQVNALGVALSRKGFRAEVRRTSFGAGRTVYRLLVPGFPDRDAALTAGKQLKRLFREDRQIAALAR